jgi:glycosyltransferase involved in cell wall biosynthesis
MLTEASALAVPSRDEGFSLMVLEAFAAGLPVVASRVGGVPEAAGEAARLVKADDPGALASALRDVLPAGPARDELGARGRERIHGFTTAKMVERYLDVYRVTAQGH